MRMSPSLRDRGSPGCSNGVPGKMGRRFRGRCSPDRGHRHVVEPVVRVDVNLGEGTRFLGGEGAIGCGKTVVEDDLPLHVEGVVVDEGSVERIRGHVPADVDELTLDAARGGRVGEGVVDGLELRRLRGQHGDRGTHRMAQVELHLVGVERNSVLGELLLQVGIGLPFSFASGNAIEKGEAIDGRRQLRSRYLSGRGCESGGDECRNHVRPFLSSYFFRVSMGRVRPRAESAIHCSRRETLVSSLFALTIHQITVLR